MILNDDTPDDVMALIRSLEAQADTAHRRLAEHIKLNAVLLVALKISLPCVEDHETDRNVETVRRAVAMAEGRITCAYPTVPVSTKAVTVAEESEEKG
jgi:hypothetical protein